MKKRKVHLVFYFLIFIMVLSFYIFNKNKTNDINSINLDEIEDKNFKLKKNDYLEDFNYAFDILKQYYPFFEINKKVCGIDWIAKRSEYENYILESKNDRDFYKCPKFKYRLICNFPSILCIFNVKNAPN